jgi:hypothetical protein
MLEPGAGFAATASEVLPLACAGIANVQHATNAAVVTTAA